MSTPQGLVRGFSPVEIWRAATAIAGDSFSVPKGSENLVISGAGTDGSLTALVVDLEISHDGGTTWKKISTGSNIVSVPVRINVTGLAGCLLRFVGTTVTLNTATAAKILATVT